MRLALEDEGYTVEDVASGEDAVSRFAEGPRLKPGAPPDAASS